MPPPGTILPAGGLAVQDGHSEAAALQQQHRSGRIVVATADEARLEIRPVAPDLAGMPGEGRATGSEELDRLLDVARVADPDRAHRVASSVASAAHGRDRSSSFQD
jgi:hypothetical protein